MVIVITRDCQLWTLSTWLNFLYYFNTARSLLGLLKGCKQSLKIHLGRQLLYLNEMSLERQQNVVEKRL